ncbi:ZIP family metal transporter [Niveibacterium sp. 24ML]|uniref:ZIP family metal transporter n=1 Tax=Niveibacterium sp. 24ML TaxID=2985512 RepID=UPI00226F4DD9|nr:ZIP family metal transporter [Niveibacterium sp. 24ML]MCX9155107.1 ZIP family metal transporter [Niveibacterium sp. 24ML]
MSALAHAVIQLPARKRLGLAIALAGAAVLASRGLQAFASNPMLIHALAAGGLGALATALGALPALAAQRIGPGTRDTLLGLGGGVMLAAALISLALPAISESRALGASTAEAIAILLLGAGAGAMGLAHFDRLIPHAHAIKHAIPAQTLLFVTAIAVHNIPEGLALGVAYGAGESADSSLAIAIALQDVPEGLIVALALLGAGLSAPVSVGLAAATGLAEPLFAMVGAGAVSDSKAVLPWGLAFASGAMLFAVLHEIVPRVMRTGHRVAGLASMAAGVAVFAGVQIILG